MNQYHYVVFYDEGREGWYVDWGTTVSAFPDGTVYDREGNEWHLGDAQQIDLHGAALINKLGATQYN